LILGNIMIKLIISKLIKNLNLIISYMKKRTINKINKNFQNINKKKSDPKN